MEEYIRERIENFWGYGNLDGDTWFVGLEEHFEGSQKKLEERIRTRHEEAVVDIQDEEKTSEGHRSWFEDDASFQPTWGRLIRVLLTARGETPVTKEKIREYQRNRFAREDSDEAVLEILPLPNPTQGEWLYSDYDIDFLESRESYKDEILPKRQDRLAGLRLEHKPDTVVFYGVTHKDTFQGVANAYFDEVKEDIYYAENDGTSYYLMKHPVAGLKNQYLEEIGKMIQK
jgi:hypothetical protein